MSAEETSKTESAPASKEDSKPVTQPVTAKQKQVVVSGLEICNPRHFKSFFSVDLISRNYKLFYEHVH